MTQATETRKQSFNRLSGIALSNLLSKPVYMSDPNRTPAVNLLWVDMSQDQLRKIFDRAGLDLFRDFKRLPLPYVEATPEMLAILDTRIYGSEPRREGSTQRTPLCHCYSLQLQSNGNVIGKYSQIIGSFVIGGLTPDENQILVEDFAEQLKLHHAELKRS